MKVNKLYKVLRVVFLTLAIISLVFSLSKKFVKAASSSSPQIVTSLPFLYGDGSGFGYSDSSVFDYVEDIVNNWGSYDPGNSSPLTFVYMIEETQNGFILGATSGDIVYTLSGSNYPSLDYIQGVGYSYLYNGSPYNVPGYYFICSNGTVTRSSSAYNTTLVSTWLTNSPSGGSIVKSNVALYGYPLYISTGSSSFNGNLIFDVGSSDGGFDGPGFITGDATGTLDDSTGDIQLDIQLQYDDSGIKGKIDYFIERVEEGLGILGGKIDTFKDRVVQGFGVIGDKLDTFKDRVVEGFGTLATIPSKVQSVFDYITEPFDNDKFNIKFQQMALGQELSTFRSDINSFTGVFDVSPATSEQVQFSIPFTLPYVNLSYNAVIDFSFYDNIRSIIIPFVTVFLVFGMCWSLIRSIPGILHGTSPDGDS